MGEPSEFCLHYSPSFCFQHWPHLLSLHYSNLNFLLRYSEWFLHIAALVWQNLELNCFHLHSRQTRSQMNMNAGLSAWLNPSENFILQILQTRSQRATFSFLTWLSRELNWSQKVNVACCYHYEDFLPKLDDYQSKEKSLFNSLSS